MDKLNTYLKIEAMKHGLCQQWTNEWSGDCSVEELVDKYKRGLDFCIKHKYPSREYIDSHFDKEELRALGLYHSLEDFDDTPGSDIFIIQHGSRGTLHFKGYDAATVWVLEGCDVSIIVEDHAFVMIHTVGKTELFVNKGVMSTAKVNKHGNEASVNSIGGVSVIESKQLYK